MIAQGVPMKEYSLENLPYKLGNAVEIDLKLAGWNI